MKLERRNLLLCGGVYLYWMVFYNLTNHFPLREPALLPLFSFEESVPLIPMTVWIYLSAFIQPLGAVWVLYRRPTLQEAARMMGAMITLSCLVFVLFPTTMARPPFQVADLSTRMLAFLQSVDQPTNCFPSLHVSVCIACALATWMERRLMGGMMLLWAGLIALSTLTTKQHYMLDIIGGTAVVLFFFLLF